MRKESPKARLRRLAKKEFAELLSFLMNQYGNYFSSADIIGKTDDEIRELVLNNAIWNAINSYWLLFNPNNPAIINEKPLKNLVENIKIQATRLNDGKVWF